MVLDTSVLLAVFFKEKNYHWAVQHMQDHGKELRMSTINLAETLIRLQDRQPQIFKKLEEELIYSGIRFVSPDIVQAKIAAQARIEFPLNLGDCFVYALAIVEDCPILTLDKDFRAVGLDVISPN